MSAPKRLQEFRYEKEPGKVETRKVLVLRETSDSIEGIDLKNLDPKEQEELFRLAEKFETDTADFVKKAWRKFLRSKIR